VRDILGCLFVKAFGKENVKGEVSLYSGGVIVDADIEVSRASRKTWFDVGIVNPTNDSMLYPKDAEGNRLPDTVDNSRNKLLFAANHKEAEKRSKYANHLRNLRYQGSTFVPAAFEASGGMGRDITLYIEKLCIDPVIIQKKPNIKDEVRFHSRWISVVLAGYLARMVSSYENARKVLPASF